MKATQFAFLCEKSADKKWTSLGPYSLFVCISPQQDIKLRLPSLSTTDWLVSGCWQGSSSVHQHWQVTPNLFWWVKSFEWVPFVSFLRYFFLLPLVASKNIISWAPPGGCLFYSYDQLIFPVTRTSSSFISRLCFWISALPWPVPNQNDNGQTQPWN